MAVRKSERGKSRALSPDGSDELIGHDVSEADVAEPQFAETSDPIAAAPDLSAEAPASALIETVTEPVAMMAEVAAQSNETRAKVKSTMDNVMKTAEDMMSFGQGNVEAFIKSGQIWAAGVQDISKSFAATAQAQLDQTVSTWKALAGVKSMKDVFDLQSTLAKSSFEHAMAESGKLTDASMKLAEQTFAPITARVSLAVEKFGRPTI